MKGNRNLQIKKSKREIKSRLFFCDVSLIISQSMKLFTHIFGDGVRNFYYI